MFKDWEVTLDFKRTSVTLVLVSLLAACSTVKKTALAPESKQKIKTVAVFETPEPQEYFLNPGQLPGGAALYAFGALGGLVLGGIEANRMQNATSEFMAAIKPTQPDVARHWNQNMLSQLQAKGYQATVLPPMAKPEAKDNEACGSVAGKYDAVLLTGISTGYAETSSVEPRVVASVRLLAGDCQQTYFEETFLYAAQPLGSLTHLPSDAQFTFPSRAALMADPLKAKEALRSGLGEIAKKATSAL